MHFFFCSLLSVVLLALPVTGLSGTPTRDKAKLSEPAMSDSIDQKTQAPLEVSSNFAADTGTLFATVKLSDAPRKTEVRVLFFLVGESEQQIAEDAIVTNGTGYLSFELNPPASGWPISGYKVVFFLNGQETEHLVFTVDNLAIQSADKKSPVNGEDLAYKTFRDSKFGFSFELPKTWEFQVAAGSGDYVFSGPEETNASEITIIVQIIDSRMGEMSDLKAQMLDLVGQISQAPQAEIVKKNQTEVAGQVAPFFIATYQAVNKMKQTVEFGHTQLGLLHEPYFLLVSYAAPRKIYQEQIDIFQHMADTFELSTPE